MSQVWRRLEVGKHKRCSLNTRLSSDTSANTSYRSRNAPGRMIRSDLFWYGNNLKMKPTYREKNLLDYLFEGFRSTLKIILDFLVKHNICFTQKNVYLEICTWQNVTSSLWQPIWGPSGLQTNVITPRLYFCSDTVPLFSESELVLFISITYYRSKRFFSIF